MKRISIAAALAFAAACLSFAQPAQPAPAPAIVNILPVTDNLDKAEEFYHRLLGLESEIGDPRARLAWYPQAPFLDDMYGVKGNTRNFFLRIPGSDLTLEAEQFSGSKAKRLDTHVQDPGAVQLIFMVNNLDLLAGWLTKGGAKILSAGGKPVSVTDEAGAAREALIQDFNGFFVKLIQRDAPPKEPAIGVAPTPYINGVSIGVTVDDTEKTARFYRDLLGVDVKTSSSFTSDANRVGAFGLKNAQYRESAVVFPEKTPQLRFFEFKGVDRKPLRPGVADPNSVLIRINVRDIDSMVAKAKAAGGQIMNISGGVTAFGRNRFLIVKDPNGVHLQLLERAPAPAPTP
jgi:predicted enzyme related to lactoylglutathione lyase